MKKIKVTGLEDCKRIDWREIYDFQGGFKKKIGKKQLEKLKSSLIKHGFFVPKFVWFDGDKAKLIDGHQTRKALESLYDEGYEIPGIPCVEIQAENRKDAAEKLMLINSRYAIIDPDGAEDWLKDIDISPIEFDEIVELVEIPELILKEDVDLIKDEGDDYEDQIDYNEHYPLSIVLDSEQYEAWNNIKRETKTNNDTKAFLKITGIL